MIGKFFEIPRVAGTGIFLQLDTQHNVSLGDTFIGNSDWPYINTECERIYAVGGLRIESECIHTRGRPTAQPLRRKMEALITESEEPIMVDFSNVSQASSSFLDELLGKLALSLGEKQFHQKLRIVNASDHIMNMANVVIHQRLSRGIG
ncbi:MAG: STAS-like domain-containing protein [Anaerolineae bacterium]|nr:STAS-like domain-containing protein [Anaerolineae bacterium]